MSEGDKKTDEVLPDSAKPEDFGDEILFESVNEDDIRKMADALAPQISELEEVLRDFNAADDLISSALEQTNISGSFEEDDEMDDELQQLAMSEQALREELEFASEFGSMFSPVKGAQESETEAPPLERPPTEEVGEKPPEGYTLQDHADHLKLRTEKVGGWYYCDMSNYLHSVDEGTTVDLVKDYCLPVPFRKLKRLYSGLVYHEVVPAKAVATPFKTPRKTPSKSPGESTPAPSTPAPSTPGAPASTPATPATPMPPPPPPPVPQEEPLPVRTVAIRLRPDVLCGAIMDAVYHAFEILPPNCISHVFKRQGGHLRGGVYVVEKKMAYIVDAQLCTQKNDELERRLILRFYHVQDDPDALNELSQALQNKVPPSPLPEEPASEDKNAAYRHMKQSCSLIQRLMAAQQQGKKVDAKQQSSWLGLKDTAFGTKSEMQRSIGAHLESNFKPCPSVREENKKASLTIRRLTLPSLSPKDWVVLEYAWALTLSMIEELDTRDCTFNTIATLPFGQFPSLPTLDVHYCSQLRRLSREAMIAQLLKSAKDLEDYAKGAEYNCAICITLLKPMIILYGIPPVTLPKSAKPLREYPLDYTPPQIACPPWGNLVMEALNKVTKQAGTDGIDALSAVKMVYDAFVKQDDLEQAARLGRKNAQIMDRLAALQAHQRSLIENIRDSHVYCEKASQEGALFLKRSESAKNAGTIGFPRFLRPETPILSFRASVSGKSSGMCYITASKVMFAGAYIPLVSSKTVLVFDLKEVTFEVDTSTPSTLLNPFPNTMKVLWRSTKNVLHNFRPSLNPAQLHKFLKIVQSFVEEEKTEEFSGVVENVSVVEDDGVMRLSEAPSDDQLSI